jgi:hypothetical protein
VAHCVRGADRHFMCWRGDADHDATVGGGSVGTFNGANLA